MFGAVRIFQPRSNIPTRLNQVGCCEHKLQRICHERDESFNSIKIKTSTWTMDEVIPTRHPYLQSQIKIREMRSRPISNELGTMKDLLRERG